MPPGSEDAAAAAPFCRICHDEADGSPGGILLEPCACSGSMQHVHLRCLQAWRVHAMDPSVCGVCTAPYRLPDGVPLLVCRPRPRSRRFSGVLQWILAGAALLLCSWDAARGGWRARKEEAERRERRSQQRRLYSALGMRQPPLALSIQVGVTGCLAFDAWRASRRRPLY